MAELAYAADLKSAAFGLEGSSPSAPTSSEVLSALSGRLIIAEHILCENGIYKELPATTIRKR